jgi:hypothetical protein
VDGGEVAGVVGAAVGHGEHVVDGVGAWLAAEVADVVIADEDAVAEVAPLPVAGGCTACAACPGHGLAADDEQDQREGGEDQHDGEQQRVHRVSFRLAGQSIR